MHSDLFWITSSLYKVSVYFPAVKPAIILVFWRFKIQESAQISSLEPLLGQLPWNSHTQRITAVTPGKCLPHQYSCY